MKFGSFEKDEFEIDFPDPNVIHSPKTCSGKFKANNCKRTLTMDFYKMDQNKPTDHMDDWIKCNTKSYSVLKLSTTEIVLIKK